MVHSGVMCCQLNALEIAIVSIFRAVAIIGLRLRELEQLLVEGAWRTMSDAWLTIISTAYLQSPKFCSILSWSREVRDTTLTGVRPQANVATVRVGTRDPSRSEFSVVQNNSLQDRHDT
jgi:hypothetical protein